MTGAQRIIGGTTSALAFRVGNARKARTVPYGSSTSLDWFSYVNTMCIHIRTISSLRVLKIEHISLTDFAGSQWDFPQILRLNGFSDPEGALCQKHRFLPETCIIHNGSHNYALSTPSLLYHNCESKTPVHML